MFDVGFSELLIIAVIALLVLGPERLPKAARFAGLWVRRARAQWHSVRAELERELASEEMKRSLEAPLSSLGPQMRALEDELRVALDDAQASPVAEASPLEDLPEQPQPVPDPGEVDPRELDPP